jgi:hypothetical protein
LETFELAGKRVETRMLVRHDDGEWAGYTYEWLDDESDALLLPSSKAKSLPGGHTWYFPRRDECVQCHTVAAGRTLGLELGQLNRYFRYPSTNRLSNQIATLEHIGMLDAALPDPIATIAAYPDPLGSAPLEPRARAYLHANCAMCHRPNAATGASFDVRFTTALHDAGLCGVASQLDDLGLKGATLLSPGAPSQSLLSLRAHAHGAVRMPPIASSVVDDDGLRVLDEWIGAIASCP